MPGRETAARIGCLRRFKEMTSVHRRSVGILAQRLPFLSGERTVLRTSGHLFVDKLPPLVAGLLLWLKPFSPASCSKPARGESELCKPDYGRKPADLIRKPDPA
jgi:hypothetical protein